MVPFIFIEINNITIYIDYWGNQGSVLFWFISEKSMSDKYYKNKAY